MIYFTSDTHYGHKNICEGTSSWEDKERCRKYSSLQHMNDSIVEGINYCVKADDELWHIGDWSFGGLENAYRFRERLLCKNIHLIYGNHDQNIEANKDIGDPYPSAQSLFSSVDYYKEIKVNGVHIILCHYAMRVWHKSHHGSWQLYGHSHGTLPDYSLVKGFPTKDSEKAKTMDVGIDTHPEFRPYSFTELKEIMDRKGVLLNIDHHNTKTT